MHRFLTSKQVIDGDVAVFPEEEARHALKVLRLKTGDEVVLSDGEGGLWGGYLIEAGEKRVAARLVRPLPGAESPARITLYQGYPKADKLDLIAQKAAELGAARIVPVLFSRSVARGGGEKLDRLARIVREAVKQCGRSAIPVIEAPMPFDKALMDMKERALLLLPWEDARGNRLRDEHARMPGASDIGLVVGPEGGISEDEVQKMKEIGARCVTLGPRILRTETAAIAAVSCAQSLWGDL